MVKYKGDISRFGDSKIGTHPPAKRIGWFSFTMRVQGVKSADLSNVAGGTILSITEGRRKI
jgi:hypothetical protein